MSIRLTSGGDLKSVLDGRAMAGQALLGCLLMSSFQVCHHYWVPWATWCYGSHPLFCHSLDQLSSEARGATWRPIGSFFALVLHKVLSAIDADDECLDLLSKHGSWMMWYWLVRRHQ